MRISTIRILAAGLGFGVGLTLLQPQPATPPPPVTVTASPVDLANELADLRAEVERLKGMLPEAHSIQGPALPLAAGDGLGLLIAVLRVYESRNHSATSRTRDRG